MATNGIRKTTGWLTFFFFMLVLATTALLLGLLTPSWQLVYLEDGRTEHHHGLWLDCKRDFSYDYGRPREYYETLHRRYDLGSPFDQFWFPSLNCVFKFDYWLDDEDWYEHNYDENKLWGDAYQHLFLGWKIAALAAHLLSAICALFALISLICAYCHRLCTCIAAVLVVISVLSGLVGNVIFYMFASDQDNNIIKEEDGIYQQHFGWSFWVSLLGNMLMLFCSMIGCIATKVALGTGRRPKFIKIQLDDLDDDSAQLLNQITGTTGSTGTTSVGSMQPQQQQPFRRSRSTVYKIDSQELRQWEKEAMRSMRQRQQAQMGQFKRTNSMPSMKKGSQLPQSTSDLSQAITEPPPRQFIPHDREHHHGTSSNGRLWQPKLASGEEAQTNSHNDVIYEYVDQPPFSAASGSTPLKHGESKRHDGKDSRPKMAAANHYDPVPLASTLINGTHQRPMPKGQLIQPVTTIPSLPADAEYLAPKSLSSQNSTISTAGRRTPLIVPLENAKAISSSPHKIGPPHHHHVQSIGLTSFGGGISGSSTFEVDEGGQCPPQIPLSTFPCGGRRPSLGKLPAEMGNNRQRMVEEEEEKTFFERPKPPIRSRSSHRLYQPTILSEVPPIVVAEEEEEEGHRRIRINTFQQQDNGTGLNRFSRSITDLIPLAGTSSSSPAFHAAFDHRRLPTESSEKSTGTRSTSGTTTVTGGSDRAPTFLGQNGRRQGGGGQFGGGGGTIRERLESILSSPSRRAPSEMDRSIGSSRTGTFLGGGQTETTVSPANSGSNGGESESNVTIVEQRRAGLSKMEFESWTDV